MEIKLYVRTGDPYSDMLRNLLKFHNIVFDTIEISRDAEKRREMYEISGQYGTPVIKIGDKVFSGFDREKIKEVLGINGKEDNNAIE